MLFRGSRKPLLIPVGGLLVRGMVKMVVDSGGREQTVVGSGKQERWFENQGKVPCMEYAQQLI